VRTEARVIKEGRGAAGAGERSSSRSAARSARREHERLRRAARRSAEEAVLEPDIDVAANGCIGPGDQLPCKSAVAVAELLDARIAGTCADIAADAAIAAEIKKCVDHSRIDTRAVRDAEVVGRDERRSRTGVDRSYESIVRPEALHLGVLVAELAFEPE